MIRVLLADDQDMVRTGFKMILSAEADIEVVGEAADGRSAVSSVELIRPDVVLMDIRMPLLDGIGATREITHRPDPPTRVLILTTFDDDEHVYAALSAGASGFLIKDAPAGELVNAIRVVAAGEAMLAPSVTSRLIKDVARRRPSPGDVAAIATLSGREREVLIHMADGLTNAEIATALFLGEATVKTHVARVLQKLGARDRVQAVISAHRARLV
jgi:DNA-binding NarL/FixJ family response regulator